MAYSSSQSPIESGAVLPTVEDDDEPRVVSIPGFSKLPEATRRALYEQYDVEERIPTLDLGALNSKLLALTPPPDPDAYITRARSLEEQARHALLEDGCPPCYPVGFEFPLQNVPEEYEALSYYHSLDDTGLVPLRVQLSDWKKFRDYQKRIRRYHLQQKTFRDFEEQVRDRRRRHNLEEHVSLCSDAEKQTQSQNMIEFQNYHLDLYERLKDDIATDRSALDAARKALEIDPCEDTKARVEELQLNVEEAESKVQLYEKVLRWTEQQRITKATEQAVSNHDMETVTDQNSMPTPTSPGCRNIKEKTCAPLRPVRSAVFKKPTTKLRSLQSTRRNALQAFETTPTVSNLLRGQGIPAPQVESTAATKEGTLLRLSCKAAKTTMKITPLRPFCPRKVTKTTKNVSKGEASATTEAKMLSSGRSHRPREVHECTYKVEKRRSGRKVKKPKRWGFEPTG